MKHSGRSGPALSGVFTESADVCHVGLWWLVWRSAAASPASLMSDDSDGFDFAARFSASSSARRRPAPQPRQQRVSGPVSSGRSLAAAKARLQMYAGCNKRKRGTRDAAMHEMAEHVLAEK
eukprot:3886462-Alexandrium_andersonii.AAC.1